MLILKSFVITVYSGAKETCPMFSRKVKHQLHIGFNDPSDVQGTAEFIQSEFIHIHDKIKKSFYDFYLKTKDNE